MDLDTHDSEASQPASTMISTTPEEERMTSNTSQAAPIARAVGASGATAMERHSAEVLKVFTRSRPSAVAGAIAGVIREHKYAEVQAIGAGAVNQAVKALVLATGYLKNDGINVVCVPEFVDVEIEDKVRTAIKLVIDPR